MTISICKGLKQWQTNTKKHLNLFGGIEPFAYLCSVKKMTTWIVEIRRSLSKADSVVSIISRYREKLSVNILRTDF